MRRIGLVVLAIMVGLFLSIIAFRFVNPPITPVMVAEKLRGTTLKYRFVPLGSIARDLPLAVIASEDGRFCNHWGVDWAAVKDAVQEARKRGRGFRGASTIPMQTAKNLYLWTDRSYVRKVLEVPLAYLLTHLLAQGAGDRGLSQHRPMGPWHLRGRGGEPALLPQERLATDPARGPSARGVAARPAAAQSGQAQPANAAHGQGGRAQDAGPRRALGLRRA